MKHSAADGAVRAHPYNNREPIPLATKILIIGTCPPPRFENLDQSKNRDDEDFDFYYGSKDNQFWSCIMPKIFDSEFPNSRDRWRDFLKTKEIWMCDILETYTRKLDDAKDTNLRPVSFCDLASTFKRCPSIDTLLFTGGHAEKWSRTQMINQRLIGDQQWKIAGRMPRPRDIQINVDGVPRTVRVRALPSPTPSSDRRYNRHTKVQMYREQFVR